MTEHGERHALHIAGINKLHVVSKIKFLLNPWYFISTYTADLQLHGAKALDPTILSPMENGNSLKASKNLKLML